MRGKSTARSAIHVRTLYVVHGDLLFSLSASVAVFQVHIHGVPAVFASAQGYYRERDKNPRFGVGVGFHVVNDFTEFPIVRGHFGYIRLLCTAQMSLEIDRLFAKTAPAETNV